ncbi:ABC transporter permease [Anaerofilum sp. BX8]|uniref:ABC transporter permease n=1 Tax=Anaerofilum hominis TaxID=2763016 RepID=A0A923IAI4_9FIRM|nr:ABC transporter permease [Anaerofilum hominis]MBC5581861.1 ABC transporter permease [Anaerofilum hominis]
MDWSRVWEHFTIVAIASVFTILLGLLLGFTAHLNRKAGKVILAVVDVLQTIPALALLGIIMVFFGGSRTTVIVGLVLYSLLPVVRNTCTGLESVSPAVKEAALGMGMSKTYRLFRVEFPIAFPTIFTGIRIAVVTSISVAVFGTFVGGGGLGQVIYRGIYVQDMSRILFGTVSLMVMAVVLDFIMSLVEKRLYRHQM